MKNYDNKFRNLDEMDKFVASHKLPKVTKMYACIFQEFLMLSVVFSPLPFLTVRMIMLAIICSHVLKIKRNLPFLRFFRLS